MRERENVVRSSSFATAPTAGFGAGTVLKETFQIVRPLGEGGCGEVYLASHTRLPGAFAVKVLHQGLTSDREALARFRQEAEITSALRHPHIVQVFDFDVAESGAPYLVMELLEGVPLSDLAHTSAPLEPGRAVHIIEQIAQALAAAHERGVVHRDLKPENVMLLSVSGSEEDFVKVVDFGISQASWRTRLTENDRVSGTPQYMAPEQACGLRDQIDHRTDQFSLAAIAYTLLTGREPFRGDEPLAVLYQVVHHQPPTPDEVNPALSTPIGAVIMRGLAKEPADRFANVLEFATALRAVVDAATAATPAAPEAAPAVAPPNQEAAMHAEPIVTAPPGQETKRLIRRLRRKNAAPRRLLALTCAVGLATLAWFHPKTRAPTRAAWHQLSGEVHRAIDHLRS